MAGHCHCLVYEVAFQDSSLHDPTPTCMEQVTDFCKEWCPWDLTCSAASRMVLLQHNIQYRHHIYPEAPIHHIALPVKLGVFVGTECSWNKGSRIQCAQSLCLLSLHYQVGSCVDEGIHLEACLLHSMCSLAVSHCSPCGLKEPNKILLSCASTHSECTSSSLLTHTGNVIAHAAQAM